MHIPQGTTDNLVLEPFQPALEAALQPSPSYDVNRWLYVPNTYSEYRYILGTRGEHPLICVGINPSTAAPDALDPTLQSVERIASWYYHEQNYHLDEYFLETFCYLCS